MNGEGSTLARIVGGIVQFAFGLYIFVAMGFTAYFNWTYARDHGVVSWVVFGEVVATAKAVVWPYFVATNPPWKEAPSPASLPRGVQNFFFSMDALVQANEEERDMNDPGELRAILGLLHEAVDSAAGINRYELNQVYPNLGDHFMDDAIGAAQFYIDAFEAADGDQVMRGAAAWIRWTNWWNPNASDVLVALSRRYGLEVR